MPESFLLSLMTLLPFAGALTAAFLPRHARNAAVGVSSFVALGGIVCGLLLYPGVKESGVRADFPWMPELGLNIILRLDGLSWLFAMLVLGMGILVVIYARYYMSPQDPVPRFFCFLLAFMGAMLGIVMSGNLIQLVLFWELTSLFSFLLIGYWHHNANARDGARMALTVTAAGGLCLLVGMILIGHVVGSFDLDVVLASGDTIREHSLYMPLLVLILLGALTKSAQFPFFFWLPHAMTAPTPVSAYLHSATMVKAGVFLLIRLWPVLAGTDAWFYLVGGAGLLTLTLGAYAAIFQHDLKGLLAYSTISHLGLITLLLGLETRLALVAAIFHTLNHATFKASLFMAVGIIDHETGTRDIRKLSGLKRYMPITARLAMVATAAMAGVPLLNGFLSKEMFLAETLGHSLALPAVATLASAFAVVYSLRFMHKTFFGPPPEGLERAPHEPPRWMRFPIELLVLTCILVGIFPQRIVGGLLDLAVGAVLGADAPAYSLAIWHGINPAMLMSVAAMTIGGVLYIAFRDRLNANTAGAPLLYRFRGKQAYDAVLTLVTIAAQMLERLLGTRRLQAQMRFVIGAVLLAAGMTIARQGLHMQTTERIFALPDTAFIAMWIAGCGCALAAAYHAKFHRLLAMTFLGGAGFISCLTFVWLSAPDLAVTQLLVEIVTTILLLLGLRWLPKRKKELRSDKVEPGVAVRRSFDLFLAIFSGIGVAVVSYAVMTRPLHGSIADFFIRHAYTEAGGRNVVNVLLVDFRAFDTLGEITVLGVVGLTVFALLRRFRPAADSLQRPEQQRRQTAYEQQHEDMVKGGILDDYLLLPRLVIKWMFPFIVVFAIFLFMRGHDLPGGGFAAGVALSIAFILQYIAFGVRWVEARLSILPLYWIGIGILLAALTGAAALMAGYPFLTSYFSYAELPVLGKLPMASALLFDLGVFILVIGATTLILLALAHQSIRTPREVKAVQEEEPEADALPAPEVVAAEPPPEAVADDGLRPAAEGAA